jgi:nicotinate-nucleotide pyrophosphorylase (carboxylating)
VKFPAELSTALLRNIESALAEDIGAGDLTAQLIPADANARATVISREDAILCGAPWFDGCFKHLDEKVKIRWYAKDGDKIAPNQILCEIRGKARAMLSAERPALNFLQTLSATASNVARYVDSVTGTAAQIMDTRKTLPGLRLAQKYAVRCGGGINQRTGLYDGILIKENHILAAGGIPEVLRQAAAIAPPGASVQIEVENLKELRAALDAGAKLILLDNFTLKRLREAVALTNKRAILEASGGITQKNVRAIAETGVDRISIGSLTKDIKAVDLSMRFLD